MGHLAKIANRIAQNADGRINSYLIQEKLKGNLLESIQSEYIYIFLAFRTV